MEMSIEDYTREQQKCLTNIVKYELKKNPRYTTALRKRNEAVKLGV